jgi:di/tricarboxylate transporter
MGTETLLLGSLILVAVVLFVSEILPIEVTAMALLAMLLVTGLIRLEDALAGFGNKAVLTIGCMFVLSHALTRTGALETLAEQTTRRLGHRPWAAIGLLLFTAGLLSGFLNNTAVVAIFLPLALNLCHRLRISSSKVLLPLSYASIFGGTLTLIGTSTNLLVSSLMESAGIPAFGLFEFSRLGVFFWVLGLAYLLALAPRLLPARTGVRSLTRNYHMAPYLTEVRITPGSGMAGRSCRQVELSHRYDITALAVLRRSERHTESVRDMQLEPDDILIVRGGLDDLLRLRRDTGIAFLSDLKLSEEDLSGEGQRVAQALIAANSDLIGRNLKEIDFRRRFGAFVLAVRRHGSTLHQKIAHIRLEFGDSLLLLGPQERIEELRQEEGLIVATDVSFDVRRRRLWWLAIAVVPAMVGLAAAGVMDIAEAALLTVVFVLVTGVVKPQEAYRSVDWSVLVLIAAFVPVGRAMMQTGTAQFIASGALSLVRFFPESWAPAVALSLVYLMTSLLTQIVSNNATAIVVVPIAVSLAGDLGVDPRPYLVAVCFAASAEFMTPFGYQTNMMVYGPGGYRFVDYLRFGAPLNLSFWLMATFLIPRLWPM